MSRLRFALCDACKTKPGNPELCMGCQHNRDVIESLLNPLKESSTAPDIEHLNRMRGGVFAEESPGTLVVPRMRWLKLRARDLSEALLESFKAEIIGENTHAWSDELTTLIEEIADA